jgi:AcrR family transcriptional regulator
LEADGLHGFNTNAVAAKAGVSVGSLYQYFPNKDAILLALINSFEDATQEAILQALQSGKGWPLKTSLKLFVRALVGMHYRRPKLNRVLEAEEERLGGGADDFAFRPGLRDLLQDTRTKSQRQYPERQSASPWRFCGRWSIKASRLARANRLLSGKPCVP